MTFASLNYLYFFLFLSFSYYLIGKKKYQNALLLVASYFFYGFIHPWFCVLLFVSTLVDYAVALAINHYSRHKKKFLIISLITNLGLLFFFKYANFFIDNACDALAFWGLPANKICLNVLLPVGISFYTFQTLSYTIDVYKGELQARKSFLDFALFVSFFSQLVAGPIERASFFLKQIENNRSFCPEKCKQAVFLFIRGYFKKLVIADNLSPWVDQVFSLEQGSFCLFASACFLFSLQIFCDFSAYTDIARASAKVLGFEHSKNFCSPYLACSPSDFWKRWHISFSTWIRDYLYIPLGGSKGKTFTAYMLIITVTMGISGLWHGAAWNYVFWGLFHAFLLIIYRLFSLEKVHETIFSAKKVIYWIVMQAFILMSWGLFRSPSLAFFISRFDLPFFDSETLAVAGYLTFYALFISIPLSFAYVFKKIKCLQFLHMPMQYCQLAFIGLFANSSPQQFIYFQF